MTRPLSRLGLFAAVLLVGLNLRPVLAAMSPVLDELQIATGMDDPQVGLLTTVPLLLMGLCVLGAGALRRRLGDGAGIAWAIALIGCACLARWLWPEAGVLLVTAVLAGVGIAVAQSLLPAMIHAQAGEHAPRFMGLYSTAIMGGALVASATSPWIAAWGGWPAALGIWSVPAVLALAFWLAVLSKHLPPSQSLARTRGAWRRPRAWMLLALFGLATGGYALVLAWLPPFYTERGWSAELAGGLLGFVTLVEVLAGGAVSLCIGHLPDRRPAVVLSVLLLIAGLGLLVLAPLTLAWPAAVLIGLGSGALFPLALIVATDHGDSAARAGEIAGFVQGGGYLLAAVLPLAAGVVRDRLDDLTLAWALMAFLCIPLLLIAARLRPGDRL